jgi:YfiH family protein
VFSFRDSCDPDPDAPDGARVEVAFTDASIDLQGRRPGFAAFLAAVVEETGVPFARLTQVHGADVVHVVDDPPAGPSDDVGVADALVTTRRGLGLMVRVADCVPVLLADAQAGVIGAAHAGRKGVAAGVVTAAVAQMRHLGAHEITAWVGPHICGRCYEVPADLRDEVSALEPATASTTSWGTPALDLGAGVLAQLERAGVSAHDVSRCTLESPDLHSYRRDGTASGRLVGLIRRRPVGGEPVGGEPVGGEPVGGEPVAVGPVEGQGRDE